MKILNLLSSWGSRTSARRTDRSIMRVVSAQVVSAVLLVGCTAPQAAPRYGSAPVIRGVNTLTNAYRLSPGDDVAIRFLYYPDLNDETVIGPDGTVSLQYIHTVALGGKTLPEATRLLNDRFSQFIRQPNVEVTVKTYALQEIYVSGQVNNPGLVRDTVPLTLSHAIAEAGGLKLSSAVTSDVIVLRRAPDGAVVYYKVNMKNGFAGKTIDPLLNTYDVIYVPEKGISQVADFISYNLLRTLPYAFTYQYVP